MSLKCSKFCLLGQITILPSKNSNKLHNLFRQVKSCVYEYKVSRIKSVLRRFQIILELQKLGAIKIWNIFDIKNILNIKNIYLLYIITYTT